MMNKLFVWEKFVAPFVVGTKLIIEGYNLRSAQNEGYNLRSELNEGYNLRKWVFGSWSGTRSKLQTQKEIQICSIISAELFFYSLKFIVYNELCIPHFIIFGIKFITS